MKIYFLTCLRNVLCFAVLCSVAQSCLTLCNPMDRSPPGSSVHGISQAGTLEWVLFPCPAQFQSELCFKGSSLSSVMESFYQYFLKYSSISTSFFSQSFYFIIDLLYLVSESMCQILDELFKTDYFLVTKFLFKCVQLSVYLIF